MGKTTLSFYLIQWNITNFESKMVELQSQAKEKDRNVPIKLWRRQRQINKRVKQSRWVNRINFIISALKKSWFCSHVKVKWQTKKYSRTTLPFLCKRVILGPRKSGSPPLGLAVWPTALISLHCHCIYNLTTEAKNIHNFYIAFLEQVHRRKDFLAVHCTSHLGIPVYRVSFTSLRILRFFSSSVEDAV